MSENKRGAQLDDVAAEWVVKVDSGPLSYEDARSLEGWLSISERHRGAYARAQAAFHLLNAEFIEDAIANAARSPAISRRTMVFGGIGSALAAAASVAFIVTRDQPTPIQYSADKGEIRVISLSDGSLVTLDTASTIAVSMLAQERRVELVTGRALFDVAKDKARPFVVTTSGLRVKAIGTSFSVSNLEKLPFEVLVREGIVDVSSPSADHATRVGANMRVLAEDNNKKGPFSVTSVSPATVTSELSWQQGLLSFEDVRIGTGALMFSRYSGPKIVIPDPMIADITMTGLFASNDPMSFARAAATSLNLKLEVVDGEIWLRRF